MINSRDIGELTPATKKKAELFLAKCKEQGIDVIVTSTYRDMASQDALYAIGRTVKGSGVTASRPLGQKVTNAKSGDSFHNYRIAFDFCPIVNGKAMWDSVDLFQKCGEIAESVGLEWAGRWRSFKELAHCQNANGMSLAMLRTAYSNGKPMA